MRPEPAVLGAFFGFGRGGGFVMGNASLTHPTFVMAKRGAKGVKSLVYRPVDLVVRPACVP